MLFYQQQRTLTPKRYFQFLDDNVPLYRVERLSREGFSDNYSNGYGMHPPTVVCDHIDDDQYSGSWSSES
jgi:hypothetical protein